MSIETENEASPWVVCSAGVNCTATEALESRLLLSGAVGQFAGVLETKAELAEGATIVTFPLRHAPAASHKITAPVEPAIALELTTGGLIKTLTKIATGKKIFLRGMIFPVK